ncbi:hypothetical protein SBRCBS47491_001529 [Sporothrix bragantina]|uniref:MARVEL domain-containing protein n=1 Tax=Sporothrix bragantina TaxID=671064 RepID=A0ABP0AZD0_9PEZI
MAIRDHGYYGYAFVAARPLQIIALGALVGMTGNFVSQDSHAHLAAPSQVVGTLVISSIALLWTLLSVTAYDDAHVPYWVTAVLDLLFTVPFIVGAAVLGGPLGGFSCSVLPTARNSDLLAIQTKAATATSPASYILFVGDSQATCYQIMAVWGLAIALCALFAVTGLATSLLFFDRRRSTAQALPETSTTTNTTMSTGTMDHPPVIHAPSTMMPIYRSEPGNIEMASVPGKWHGSDDDEYEYEERRDMYEGEENTNTHDREFHRASVHGSLHGSVHSSFTRSSSYYNSPEQSPSSVPVPTASTAPKLAATTPQPSTAPAFPSAHGRSLHPRLIQTTRGPSIKAEDREDEEDEEDVDRNVDIDDNDVDDDNNDDDNDNMFDGGLTTPLSPPPQTHQTKYGPSGPNGTPNSGRDSAASSRYAPRTPLSPVFPGFSTSTSCRLSNGSGGSIPMFFSSLPCRSPSHMSPSSSCRISPPSSPPMESPSPQPFGSCAPPAPPAPLLQPAVMPTAGTASTLLNTNTSTTTTPSSRSLTKKYTPALVAKYTPSNPLKRSLPATLMPLAPSTSSLLWPQAFPLSPVRRQHDLPSPISPILPHPPPVPKEQKQNKLPPNRKTLLQRIEGWWDLGLLRGGTIKGRGRPLAAINAVSAMASPRSAGPHSAEPRSAGGHSPTDMDLGGQSPIAFV